MFGLEVVDIQVCVGYIEISTEDDGLRLTEFVKMFTYINVPMIQCDVLVTMVPIKTL